MSTITTKPKAKDKTVQVSLLSGLLSGSMAKLVTHPLDTIKTKIQIDWKSKHTQSISSVVSKTIQKEGVTGLYKGLPVAVLGAIPGCVLFFGSYEFAKKHLLSFRNFSNSEFLMYFMAGMWAELVSCLVFVPVDIIKERRQAQSNLQTYKYKNDLDALFTILREEKLNGIYKAYGATVMSYGPLSAFYFMFYEYFKGYFVRNDAKTYLSRVKKEDLESLKNHKLDISFYETMICSAAASGLGGLITTPLDLVKIRMQIERANPNNRSGTRNYKNLAQGLALIARTDGIRGLYRGAIARILYHMPTGALSMTFLEMFKPHVRKLIDTE